MAEASRFTTSMLIGAAILMSSSLSAWAGGGILRVTDGTNEGAFYVLDGTGSSSFITRYEAGDFDPGTLLCGASIGEYSLGSGAGGITDVTLRSEDVMNPGYPDMTAAGLITTALPSGGACSSSLVDPRVVTFPAPIAPPAGSSFLVGREPAFGAGPLDFCGLLLDTGGPPRGRSITYVPASTAFEPLRCGNHFLELTAIETGCVDLTVRFSGSYRYPGDRGRPVVTAVRPNPTPKPTDDFITLAIRVNNRSAAAVTRRITVCVDKTSIGGTGTLDATTQFRTLACTPSALGTSQVFPAGVTILRTQVCTPAALNMMGPISASSPNVRFFVLFDDPAVDVDPCVVEGTTCVDSEIGVVGLRRRPGSLDDNRPDEYLVAQTPVQTGDSLQVRFPLLDLPKISFNVTGIEVIGGEFGSSGLLGLDAIELRREDLALPAGPDFSPAGLLRSIGTHDGVGEVPLPILGAPIVFDLFDINLSQPLSGMGDLYAVAVPLAGDFSAGVGTAIASDRTVETLLGNSSYTLSGSMLALEDRCSNYAIRILLDGDRSTLPGESPPAPPSRTRIRPRGVNEAIAVDRFGKPFRR